jgi:hypothetical protein
MAAELVHAVTDADGKAVCPAEARAVAAAAGLRRGHRDARVEIEFLAERGLVRRVGIFLRKRNRRRPLVLRLQRIDAGVRGLSDIDAARLADDGGAERDGGEAEYAETGYRHGGGKQHRSRGNEFSHAKQPRRTVEGWIDSPRLPQTNSSAVGRHNTINWFKSP